MIAPQVAQVLKQDQLGRVELLTGAGEQVVRRVACGSTIPGSRWLARALMGRERRALARLAGLVGVPALVESPAHLRAPASDGAVPRVQDILLRTWIPGVPLHAVDRLPRDFFARLEDLVRELHERGVCHNDLHKEPNLLVGEGGRPCVVDFQLASVHPRRGRVFRTRVSEDLRHVEKHQRRYLRGTGLSARTDTVDPPRRRSFLASAWARCGKPLYNIVTRRLLHTSDNEPRRPATGPWPRWDPPLGPH